MSNPYDYHPTIKWYHTLWEMRDSKFRKWIVQTRRRDLRIFWKYQKHQVIEKYGMIALGISLLCALAANKYLIMWFHLFSDDPNSYMKSISWRDFENEYTERKEHLNKVLEESSYMDAKNNPELNKEEKTSTSSPKR